MACPWESGSERKQFYRPDWSDGPDCRGCEDCTGSDHRCHVFGLPGLCAWPCGIVQDNFGRAYWRPAEDAGLAERWLPGGASADLRPTLRNPNAPARRVGE